MVSREVGRRQPASLEIQILPQRTLTMALGRSCLLAKTISTASRSSSCSDEAAFPRSARGTRHYLNVHKQTKASRLYTKDKAGVAKRAQVLPRSACGATRPWPRQRGRDHCCPPQRSGPGCFGSSASTEGGSAQVCDGTGHDLATHLPCVFHAPRTLSWPPTSHTVNEMFLYSTVSTCEKRGSSELSKPTPGS